MKKEVNKEIDVNIDQDIQNAIERNYRRSFSENFKAMEDKRIKERKKERILATLTGAFIVIATIMLLIFNSKLTAEAKESCMSLGHSENYCMERL